MFLTLVAQVATFDIGRKYLQLGSDALRTIDSSRWVSAMVGAAAFVALCIAQYLSRRPDEGDFNVAPYLGAFLVPLVHLGMLRLRALTITGADREFR